MDTLDTDEYQVFQVKQQQILSNVTMIYMRMRGVDNEQATRLVIPFIHSFKKQLADLRAKLPDNIAKNSTFAISTSFFAHI